MLSFFIAQKYFVSRKSHRVINILSFVSVISVAVGSAGLIIVLSVFNGFGDLVVSLYDSFDPDIKITPRTGKTFYPDESSLEKIKSTEGVNAVIRSLEENALLRYRDRQFIARVKGVDEKFVLHSGVKDKIAEGEMLLQSGDTNYAVIGGGVAYTLSVQLDDLFSSLQIYMPKPGKNISLNPEEAFTQQSLIVSGIFSIQQDFDSRYILVPLRMTQELTGKESELSAIEIMTAENADVSKIKEQVKQIAGEKFYVKDRSEQHDFLYRILNSEKLAVFFILSFILLIATFNIIGTLSMVVIEKKNDIAILLSMGAELNAIKKIFLLHGILINFTGAFTGLVLGFLVCIAQQQFGLIKIENSESFVIENYPVLMKVSDFIYVFITVAAIGLIASWIASYSMVRKQVPVSMRG